MALEELVEVTTPCCVLCGKDSTLMVSKSGLGKWQRGEFIQRAFPDLTAGDRELLLTGTHQACWDEMWKEED